MSGELYKKHSKYFVNLQFPMQVGDDLQNIQTSSVQVPQKAVPPNGVIISESTQPGEIVGMSISSSARFCWHFSKLGLTMLFQMVVILHPIYNLMWGPIQRNNEHL